MKTFFDICTRDMDMGRITVREVTKAIDDTGCHGRVVDGQRVWTMEEMARILEVAKLNAWLASYERATPLDEVLAR